MEKRQRLRQRRDVGAVKAGYAEQDLDPVARDIPRQFGPEVIHRRTAAIVRQQARAAQFQKPSPAASEQVEIVFAFGIIPSCRRGLFGPHQAVNPDNMVWRCGGAGAVDQDHVVGMGVEPVPFKPRLMVDHRAATAQFLDEDAIAQPLRAPADRPRPGPSLTSNFGSAICLVLPELARF